MARCRITTTPFRGPVQVAVGSEVIANTTGAVALEEAMGGSTVAPVVYCIPRKDVKMERLVRTSHQTYCPFKGDASYYSVVDGPENAVWSYEPGSLAHRYHRPLRRGFTTTLTIDSSDFYVSTRSPTSRRGWLRTQE